MQRRNTGFEKIVLPPTLAGAHARQRKNASRGACLACEAVVSKAKDRADSPFCRALGREERRSKHRGLIEVRWASRCSAAYHGLAREARSTVGAPRGRSAVARQLARSAGLRRDRSRLHQGLRRVHIFEATTNHTFEDEDDDEDENDWRLALPSRRADQDTRPKHQNTTEKHFENCRDQKRI